MSTEIIFCANVVTGRIEADTGDWADDDPRWAYLTDGVYLCDATEVEPWGEDEMSMDRATEAVRDNLGFTITEWAERSDRNGELRYATVTGRATPGKTGEK